MATSSTARRPIVFNDATNKLDVTYYDKTTGLKKTDSLDPPANGVIYIDENAKLGGCSPAIDGPLEQDYAEGNGCAVAYVKGKYSSSMTIGSASDIVVDGNLERVGDTVMGLVAQNFVRVKHGVRSCPQPSNPDRCETFPNMKIQAAILTLQHSFIVDNYDQGATARDAHRRRRDRPEVPRPGRHVQPRHRPRDDRLHEGLQLRHRGCATAARRSSSTRSRRRGGSSAPTSRSRLRRPELSHPPPVSIACGRRQRSSSFPPRARATIGGLRSSTGGGRRRKDPHGSNAEGRVPRARSRRRSPHGLRRWGAQEGARGRRPRV